jgi:hypothetical protein
MVRTDCVIAANTVANRAKTIPVPTGLDGLQDALKHYQNVPTNLKNEAPLFALSILSGILSQKLERHTFLEPIMEMRLESYD